MNIPVEAWILLLVALLIYLHERGRVVNEQVKKPKVMKPRELVIFGMSHSDTETDHFHGGQNDIVLPVTVAPTSYYLVCTTNKIDVYQSQASAEHKWDDKSVSVVRLDVAMLDEKEKVTITQLTSSQTGIRTNLAYGFRTVR